MIINAETDIFCLIGHPTSKSLSPLIHNTFFELNKINAKYVVFDVKKNNLKDAIYGIKALGIKGFNVTIPYKIDIINYLDDLSEEAKTIGAVNTVKNENGRLIGFNTDGLGFKKSLEENNVDIKDKKILIIGAGGASRAISMSLAKEKIKELTILNRTVEKAEKLIKDINTFYPKKEYSFGSIYDLNHISENYDLIINCTSIGMYPNENDLPIVPLNFNKDTIVCDIVYKPIKTKLLSVAEKKGCKIINGLSMLINQGILSEEIWLDEKILLNENINNFLLKYLHL